MRDITQIQGDVDNACSVYYSSLSDMDSARERMDECERRVDQARQNMYMSDGNSYSLRREYEDAQEEYSRAQDDYDNAQASAERAKSSLASLKNEALDCAFELQKKINGFNSSVNILGGAAGNDFGAAALAQRGLLQASKQRYENAWNTSQQVISKIDSVLGTQSSTGNSNGYGGRQSGNYETGPELRGSTSHIERIGELAPKSSAPNADDWNFIING